MAMTPEEKRRLSSLMTTSALSPDYNKEEATAALEAMMREGNQLDLPSKPISTTAGASSIHPTLGVKMVDPEAKERTRGLGELGSNLFRGVVVDPLELAYDVAQSPLTVLKGELPLGAAIPLKTVQTILQKLMPEQAGSPIGDEYPDAFDIAKSIVKPMIEDPGKYIAENPADVIGMVAGLPAAIGLVSKISATAKAAKAAELAKIAQIAAQQAFEKNANKTITKFKVAPPNPHLGRDIADIETDLKAINTLRAQTQRSGNKDALKPLDIQRKLLLEAQAIKRPEIATAAAKLAEKETAKNAVMTEEGHTAYMSDEQIEAAAVAREAAIAKKKKKGGGGGGGEGEGGAGGGDSGSGGPRDDSGGTGSGLSSALLAAERTGPKFTIIQGGGQKVIKPPREVKRNTFDIIDEGEQGIPIRDKPVLDSELEDPDAQEIYDAAYRDLTGFSMMTEKPPKPLTVREQRIKDDQLSMMPVRDAEWFRRRQGEDANADAGDALRRQNNPIPEGKVTPQRPKPKYTDEEVANAIKDNPRGADEGIIDHLIRINKIIEDNKKNLEAAIRSMPDEMLTGGVERLRREQARKASSSDQRVALYAPGAGGPDTRLPLGPVDDGGMRMSDAPSGRGNRIPDIDPEEVRSAALAAIQLERAAAEAAAELPPSVKLERALAEKEYEKQFSPERAAEAAKKVESEAFWTSRPDPDAPLGVDEANDIIRTGVKGKIHPFLAEPLAAAEGADKGYQLALKDWYETVKVPDPYDPKATTVVEQLLLIDSGLAPVARSQKLKYRRGPDRVEKYVRKNEFGDGSYGRTYSVVDRNGKPKVAKISYHTGANYNQAHTWEKNTARAIQNVAANATPAEKSLYLKHFPKFEQILERPDDPGGYIIVMDELRPMRKDEEIELFKGRKALREKLKEKGFLNAEQTDDLPKQDFVIPYEHNVAARPTYGAMRKVLAADDYNKMSPRVRSFYKALEYMSDVHGIHWGDMHEGNVMIDPKTGNYVASDTGLFRVMPRSHPYYNHTYTKEQAVAEAAGRAARQGDVAALADELSGETERLATANPAEKELFKRARERGLELKAVQDAKREERLREAARQLLIQQGLVRPKGK